MRILLMVATAMLAASLTGCGGDDGPTVASDDGGGGGLAAADLDGRTFLSVRVDGYRLADSTRVRLGFAGGEVQAHAGCNHLFGTLAIEGGVLTASDMGGTEMGCPDRLHSQDAWLTEFLTAGADASLDGETLTLTGGGVTLELMQQEVPPTGGDGDEPTSDDGEVVGSG